ncbi:MAG: hypothetical protein Q8Q62_15785 [Mesorhizobium sp.]|nr:hypothetical protein [Mesorhizobium sp.]
MMVARVFTVAAMGLIFAVAPAIVHAQELGNPLPGLSLDGINTYAPPVSGKPLPELTTGAVTLAAQLIADGPDITRGLTWRIFKPVPGEDGKLPLIASAQGGTSVFQLDPGSYLIHASFGRAGATKRITIGRESRRESLVLDAGGLKLDAMLSGGIRIPADKLKFSIYEAAENAEGDRALILPDVSPNAVIRLNSGTYHVVSTYGNVNAVIRSDIRVEAGKLTEALVEHRAAQLTMKLVREKGGEAIADTSWSVLTDSGDIVKESVGAFASMVLAEGKYTIIAKNRDRIYQRDFEVEAGRNEDVEVIAENDVAAAKAVKVDEPFD